MITIMPHKGIWGSTPCWRCDCPVAGTAGTGRWQWPTPPSPSTARTIPDLPTHEAGKQRGSADRYGNPASADRQDRLVESASGSVVGRDIARESRATAR